MGKSRFLRSLCQFYINSLRVGSDNVTHNIPFSGMLSHDMTVNAGSPAAYGEPAPRQSPLLQFSAGGDFYVGNDHRVIEH